jgi:L-ascorbate metabolism protein UlaG (beta-lactamase superfamily)
MAMGLSSRSGEFARRLSGAVTAAVLALLFLVLPGMTATANAACAFGMVSAPYSSWQEQPLLRRVATRSAPRIAAKGVPAGHVRIEFLGHSSFAISTPGGVSVVTDYNGANVPVAPPDAATMNNSHETHYTDYPDPRIRYLLRGWRPGGGMARHDITINDMRVFNVPTNIGEYGDPKSNGNSVFVFEISGLCIAHVGHLHHVLTRDQLQAIGRIDVLFMPVDGGLTMGHPEALEKIRLIAPRLIIPMHFGFSGAADQFFELARKLYPIRADEDGTLVVSRKTLPKRTEILFLQGGYGGLGGPRGE